MDLYFLQVQLCPGLFACQPEIFLFEKIPFPCQPDTKGEEASDKGILAIEIAEREFSQEYNIIDVAVAGYFKKEDAEIIIHPDTDTEQRKKTEEKAEVFLPAKEIWI